jgi:uncharacterized protein (DUF58 family)
VPKSEEVPAPLRYLDAETLAKLATMTLRARVVVEGALTGLHRAPHYGSSVEFAEHKEYSAGDEIRHIDWKAYGKFDKYYVKRFEQETEVRAYLYVDCSGSMGYAGTVGGGGLQPPGRSTRRSKLEVASYLAASIAYLLVRQQDQAGLLAFGGALRTYIPPRARPQHLADLLGALEKVTPDGPTDVARAIDYLTEVVHRRSMIVILSDLFDAPDAVLDRLRHLRARGHEIVVFHVLDPDEMAFPFDGLQVFESMEDERRLLVDTRATRRTYLRELEAFLDTWKHGTTDANLTYQLVDTTRPLDRVLSDFLVGQEQRRGRR